MGGGGGGGGAEVDGGVVVSGRRRIFRWIFPSTWAGEACLLERVSVERFRPRSFEPTKLGRVISCFWHWSAKQSWLQFDGLV